LEGNIINHSNTIHNVFEIYRDLFEYANDIILVLTDEGNIIDANNQAVLSYGYSHDELKSMNIFQLRDPNNTNIARMQFEKAKINGVEFETLHYRKNGTFFPVEVKSIGINAGPDYYIASIIRDITNRRKKEEEIRVLASIVESSEDAILGTTTEGLITSWNKGAEKLYGYSKEEIIGCHASIFVPEDNSDNINAIIARVRKKERIEHYETTRKRKDGRIISLGVSVSPIYSSEGQFQGVSAIMRDLTEKYYLTKKLNEHEERLKTANELMVAHAFQTSLMSDIKQFEYANVYGKYIPSSTVGGDLYDCIEVGNSLWFIIADVIGHGLVAAMVSTMVKGMFNNCIQNCNYPHEVLSSMNKIFCKTLGDKGEHFISAFVGVIRDNTLYYSNAGHPYPVLINCNSGKTTVLEQNGFLLTMDESVEYFVNQVNITKDEKLILYTDGLFNLRDTNPAGYWDRISEHAMINIKLLTENPHEYVTELLHSFNSAQNADFIDDVSIMLISKL
jgi:PAS domain S-box-containing protein